MAMPVTASGRSREIDAKLKGISITLAHRSVANHSFEHAVLDWKDRRTGKWTVLEMLNMRSQTDKLSMPFGGIA